MMNKEGKLRIGIMTFWESNNNYGQILQLFALQRYLKSIGHQPFLIRYHRIASPKSLIIRLSPSYMFRALLVKVRKIIKKIHRGKQAENQYRDTARKFDYFKKTHVLFGEEDYWNLSDLKENPPPADIYISGSDQVWNNSIKVSAEAFLLGFGAREIRRIAYAASFGHPSLDAESFALFKKHIHNFNAISVREESGLNICNDLGITDAEWVLDPTMLFDKDHWCEMLDLKPKKKENAIFIYTLGNSDIVDKEKFLIYTKQLANYDIFHASANNDDSGNLLPTIPEWVNYIKNANLVITTSFHGIVFCILNNTNFIVLPNTGRAKGMNERITSLLSFCGLSDHIMHRFSRNEFDRILGKTIPWDEINSKIAEKRKISKEFIEKSVV